MCPSLADDVLTKLIRERTRQLLLRAAPLCRAQRARLPEPTVSFDLHGQTAGQAIWRRLRRPLLRFNLDIARRHQADFLARTVTHEVAHLVTAACHGRVRPHGPEWRAVMAHLGVPNATRCHSYTIDETCVRRQRRWTYQCACSRHELSTTRHNRAQGAQTQYQCRQCGSTLRHVPAQRD